MAHPVSVGSKCLEMWGRTNKDILFQLIKPRASLQPALYGLLLFFAKKTQLDFKGGHASVYMN